MPHEMVFILQPDGRVQGEPVCTEPPEAKCRWKVEDPECECEVYYNADVDEAGPYHTVSDVPSSELNFSDRAAVEEWLDGKHRMAYGGECSIVTWLNQDEDGESYDGSDPAIIGRREIEPSWEGDYYSWAIKP